MSASSFGGAPPSLAARIKAVALDVDGTLTDGRIFWTESGEEIKGIHFLDVMGVSRAMRLCNIRFALISGEASPLLHKIAAKFKIETVYPGCWDKAGALQDAAGKFDLSPDQFAFMGDDVNDLPAMRLAGLKAAPHTAHSAVLREAEFVSKRTAGFGAVRDLVDYLWGGMVNQA